MFNIKITLKKRHKLYSYPLGVDAMPFWEEARDKNGKSIKLYLQKKLHSFFHYLNHS